MTAGPRPWRAGAFLGQFTGAPLMGRASAKSRAGLERFVAHWKGQGCSVHVWEVLPEPRIEAAARAQPATSFSR